MQQITCETCGLIYWKNDRNDLEHKSVHNRFKYYEKFYGKGFLIPLNKIPDEEGSAYSLLHSNNYGDQTMGAEKLLKVEYMKHLRKKKGMKYIDFVEGLLKEEWIQKELFKVKNFIESRYGVAW